MGAWGFGNFDEDASAEFIHNYIVDLIKDIHKYLGCADIDIEDYETIVTLCKIDILSVLIEQKWGGTVVPKEEQVLLWKDNYLAAWQHYLRDFVSAAGETLKSTYYLPREKIIIEMFDKLLNLSIELEDYKLNHIITS